MEFTGYLAVVA